MLPVLAKAVREVENNVQRGRISVTDRPKFQAVALLAREERARVRADKSLADAERDGQLKRLEGIATILAQTAAREPSFFELLGENAEVSDAARKLKSQMQAAGGLEPAPEPEPSAAPDEAVVRNERKVVPQSVIQRQLANPFQVPDFTGAEARKPVQRRLSGWELIGPLLNSFEHAAPGAPACMELPEPKATTTVGGQDLMAHQVRLLAAAKEGHRTFLLADEPGLGKTAQALLAAQASDAYPLLAVVPNVVKTNWAREVDLWTPGKTVTVIHGDGETIDGFADIVVVNYEVLDRHVGWIGDFGFRGMVVDEAHFIKNKKSQRSQHVLEISERIRQRVARPLLMALTGTPLINDIEDFRAIWQFLGWIEEKKPGPTLMAALEESGMTPADFGFYPAARQAVVDMGIVRRRKVDVAADIPARRIADMPVELEDAVGRSIRDAERDLARRLVQRYDAALVTRRSKADAEDTIDGAIDRELVRRVAGWELHDAAESTSEENVFSMVRRIGQAKAELAADYAAQLARSAGKVVFFAKHIDVMDAAEAAFARRGIKYSSVRGDQTSSVRQKSIDGFVNDPDVSVIVCSLTAAGVGLNLQVASNVVLAELSWTNAEQTQAIDRVHRIGQTEPVTAWRIIAAQTIDAKIAELIDSKAGLAARALDGSDEEVSSSADIQLEALAALLTEALTEREADAAEDPSSL
ncbi:MAG TPA: DEAD/DEAH box helicase [Intrasporangium sp.]|nr:DEAD/DEAH box helicase [Intrasporangium sp.]